jgi:2-succinyl-5-enolpyruvyl-6-hydroxy-3-cyclohexene-1-carboxylate synthase
MTNLLASQRIVTLAAAHGIDTWCVSAGSRNSPLLAVLGNAHGIELYSFVDERAAAFFALGRAKRDRRPVGIVTTSGTAVAELLPAVVEAFYARVPLLLVTADRPARFRGTGAPQSIEQPGIFGGYVERSIDLDASAMALDRLDWLEPIPLHLNLCFDEPLLDGEVRVTRIERSDVRVESRPIDGDAVRSAIAGMERPLLLLSGLTRDHDAVRDFALRLNAPLYAEPLSGLREDPALAHLRLSNERILARSGFDGVIRIGAVPTLRFWRDLDEKLAALPLVSVGEAPFTGLARGTLITGSLDMLNEVEVVRRETRDELYALDRELAARFARILDEEPRSELAMFRALSEGLPLGCRIFLGNSLPVREWDLAAIRTPRNYLLDANRGANGIDGEISAFFGGIDATRANAAIAGDLTALYDLNAPWIVPQLPPGAAFRIFVMNNGGGRIFSRVASLTPLGRETRERIIENVHRLRFESWAAMFNLGYEAWFEIPERVPVKGHGIVELLPDAESSRRAWEQYDELWSGS